MYVFLSSLYISHIRSMLSLITTTLVAGDLTGKFLADYISLLINVNNYMPLNLVLCGRKYIFGAVVKLARRYDPAMQMFGVNVSCLLNCQNVDYIRNSSYWT